MSDYETQYTKEVVCPHCGHEHPDSLDYFYESKIAEIECGLCERMFSAVQIITVKYSTGILRDNL